SRRRHTRFSRDWSSDVCSSDLGEVVIDSTFVYELLPGPVVAVRPKSPAPVVTAGDSLWIPDASDGGRDAHFNDIPAADLADHPRSEERRVGKVRKTGGGASHGK